MSLLVHSSGIKLSEYGKIGMDDFGLTLVLCGSTMIGGLSIFVGMAAQNFKGEFV
jgi:hypothetical protein